MDARLDRLLDLLDADDADRSAGTSVRLPANLREAAALATEMGLVGSTSELTATGLRAALDALANEAILEGHFREHPGCRPDLADQAMMAAAFDSDPLAARPDLIRSAAEAVAKLRDDPSPEDVLIYAAGYAHGEQLAKAAKSKAGAA
jgi:hypothetical protein